MDPRKQTLITALQAFIAQRAGLEFASYGNVRAYRAEQRSVTKDRHQAEELLRAVSARDGVTADAILSAAARAFSGRLTIRETAPGVFSLSYCTGQYFPTEYRRAVCSVLSTALWGYWRSLVAPDAPGAGDRIRDTARAALSRAVARRWFN